MLYLVYRTTNTVNGKCYIGVHQTVNEDDGYLGSGRILRQAVRKYGRESFRREIMFRCSTPEEMFTREREVVTEDFVARPDTYNTKVGGEGGWDFVNASGRNNATARGVASDPTLRIAGNVVFVEKMKNAEFRQTHGERIREGMRAGKVSPRFAGRKHSDETKRKMSEAAKRRKRAVPV